MLNDDRLLWSEWFLLDGAGRHGFVPNSAGLYRIRERNSSALHYVGQTGAGLRRRLGQLAGVYRDEMPYNDPHTAGPGLWALRHDGAGDFEASVCEIEGDTSTRKGLECLSIAQHRLEHGLSPTLNFGCMPDGWRKSSPNNKRLVAAGKRFRGTQSDYQRPPTELLPDLLKGSPGSSDWGGLAWSTQSPFGLPIEAGDEAIGVYVVFDPNEQPATYIGQGRIRQRLVAHHRKVSQDGHRQKHLFAKPGLRRRWAELSELTTTGRLEIENDLIGTHVANTRRSPIGQFLG